jgi:hypothetical protein
MQNVNRIDKTFSAFSIKMVLLEERRPQILGIRLSQVVASTPKSFSPSLSNLRLITVAASSPTSSLRAFLAVIFSSLFKISQRSAFKVFWLSGVNLSQHASSWESQKLDKFLLRWTAQNIRTSLCGDSI